MYFLIHIFQVTHLKLAFVYINIYIYIYIYIYILKSFHVYTFSTFSSSLFIFKDLFLSIRCMQLNFFLPIMIKGIAMNSICLERYFTFTSSNSNLWVSMSKTEILKTKNRKLSREYNYFLCLIDLRSLRKYCKRTIPIIFQTTYKNSNKSNITQTFVLKPCMFLKDGEF